MGARPPVAGLRRVARSPGSWVAAVLTAARLWLGTGLAIFPLANSGRDDAMFLRFAGEILQGRWLGSYDCLTFAKVPLYPAWIASTVAAGVPLLPAQQALYVVACAAFVLAIAPAMPGTPARLLLYGALLFQPASFASSVVSRVVREGIYPALILLLLAAAAGTALRLRSPWSTAFGGALAGLALATVWLTREEGFWILPAVTLLGIAPWIWSGQRPSRTAWAVAVAAGGATFALGWGAVASMNARHYGVFATRVDSLQDAYGALTRVDHLRWRRYVPVPAETRARIYAVSPSFRRLAPLLDGPVGNFWAGSSCPGVGVCDDVGGSWFTWALRDSAQAAGRCTSGPEAERFWASVAAEVNRACSEGKLTCGPSRSSLAEPWRSEYAVPFLEAAGRAVAMLAWPRGLVASAGTDPAAGADGGPYRLLSGQRFAVWPDPRPPRRGAGLDRDPVAGPPARHPGGRARRLPPARDRIRA
jgi:hypothetical protein